MGGPQRMLQNVVQGSGFIFAGFCMCGSGADLPNIIQVIKLRKLRWAGCVAHIRERRGVYGILVGKSEGRRPLKRPWHGCEDNIKMVWDA